VIFCTRGGLGNPSGHRAEVREGTNGPCLSHFLGFGWTRPHNVTMTRNHRVHRSVAVVAAAFLIFGVAACSGDGDSTAAEVSEMSKDKLLEFLVAEGATQEEAVRIIEDLGYEWRVASIDGVPQPTTRDYREDRVTMGIDDGVVVDARWE